mmetsp:Transcript_68476/g.203716  ORF Transcript_68476/g.203716 Transcript_68476/m.203716 type:complete len:211 (-) Transcript_68476:23-655(-)
MGEEAFSSTASHNHRCHRGAPWAHAPKHEDQASEHQCQVNAYSSGGYNVRHLWVGFGKLCARGLQPPLHCGGHCLQPSPESGGRRLQRLCEVQLHARSRPGLRYLSLVLHCSFPRRWLLWCLHGLWWNHLRGSRVRLCAARLGVRLLDRNPRGLLRWWVSRVHLPRPRRQRRLGPLLRRGCLFPAPGRQRCRHASTAAPQRAVSAPGRRQ